MAEGIVAAVLVIFGVAAVLVRERWRMHDRRQIFCPRAQRVVRILDGVCQVPDSARVVGLAPLCQRECLTPGEHDRRGQEPRELAEEHPQPATRR